MLMDGKNGMTSCYISKRMNIFLFFSGLFLVLWFLFANIFLFRSMYYEKRYTLSMEGLKSHNADLINRLAGLNMAVGLFGSYLEGSEDEGTLDKLRRESSISDLNTQVINRIKYIESLISFVNYPAGNLQQLFEGMSWQNAAQGGELHELQGSADDDKNGDTLNSSALQDRINYLVALERFYYAMPLYTPMQGKGIRKTSDFGYRSDPFIKRKSFHSGVDMAGPLRSKIYSTGVGEVIRAGPYGSYGMAVEIDHGYGIVTLYGHLSKVMVKKGQLVKGGDVVGLMGSTGRSTSPHLHYEVKVNGKHVDPERFLVALKSVA